MASELSGVIHTELVTVRRGGAATRRTPRLRRRPGRGRDAAPVAFATAGDLVRLLAAVPPDTPVDVAETVRVAAGLDLHRTPAETVTALGGLPGAGGVPLTGNGTGNGSGRAAALEIGVYVVARGDGPPAGTVPFPAYESAVEALQRGDTRAALEAQVELLEWMAGTLCASADPDRPPGATASVSDPVLREQLDVESRHIRESARRLESVRRRLSRRERGRRMSDDEA